MAVAFQGDVQGLDYERLVGKHVGREGEVVIQREHTVHKPLRKGGFVCIGLIHVFGFVDCAEIKQFLGAVDAIQTDNRRIAGNGGIVGIGHCVQYQGSGADGSLGILCRGRYLDDAVHHSAPVDGPACRSLGSDEILESLCGNLDFPGLAIDEGRFLFHELEGGFRGIYMHGETPGEFHALLSSP